MRVEVILMSPPSRHLSQGKAADRGKRRIADAAAAGGWLDGEAGPMTLRP